MATFYSNPPTRQSGAFSSNDPTTQLYYGILKTWTGSTWVKSPLHLKTYLATSFQFKPLRIWTGSKWGLVNTSGA